MKNLLFLIVTLLSINIYAQHQKVNLFLGSEIEKAQKKATQISITVRGNVPQIKNEAIRLGGKVGLSFGNIVQIQLPTSSIVSFSKNEFVHYIQYNKSPTVLLNDTLQINNNAIPVHSGQAPLLDSYTGKGVLFGLIDTGIDIDHPDFQDSLGNTRILRIWDQGQPDDGSSSFGYGIVWDSSAINNGTCTHVDSNSLSLGHGTHVSGIAVGNGLAVNNYSGMAPEASIIAVALDFARPNGIVEAVNYIYNVADVLEMPCVINISAGSYSGSHDGTDLNAILIDSLMNAKPGRALVCAGGNAGAVPFHLQHQVNSDTTFTWFKYNATSRSVLFEAWADTADLNNVDFAIGANLPSGSHALRGHTSFDNIKNKIGNSIDTIQNNGNIIGIVETFGELQDDKYLLQVIIREPDSSAYYFSLMTTGSGKLDVWSSATGILNTSDMVNSGLPPSAVYPNIIYYQKPDTFQTIVGGFSCLPSVLTIGSYVNRKTYLDVDGVTQVVTETPGEIDVGSSIGPNRRGFVKPDIAATGRIVMSAAPDYRVNSFMAGGNRKYVGFGAKHVIRSGTSMASPAVAGIVALYLEKCPNASMVEIKNAIITSAKQDEFTGGVPNFSYGYGKADAFAVLNRSNYTVDIGTDQNICGEGSIHLTSSPYLGYNWSTTETTPSIVVDTTNRIYLSVINGSGCKGLSDTINIFKHPLPNKPNINLIGNDTLSCASDLNVQWFLNNTTLNGETDTIHIAKENGDYFAEVIDSFGCVNYSDTISLITLEIETHAENDLSIYPNPARDKVSIDFQNQSLDGIFLTNVMGKEVLVRDIKYPQNKIELDVHHLSEGIYYLRVNSKEKNYLKRLILIR